jgi:hypothetical protein
MGTVRYVIPYLGVVLFFLLGGGCSRDDKCIIVPGKSVGSYRLHEAMPEVHNGDLSEYARASGKGLLLSFKGDSISVISVFSTNYHTREGICLGSPESQVLAAFGEPEKRSTNELKHFLNYKNRGIQVCCKDGTVILINVLDTWDF